MWFTTRSASGCESRKRVTNPAFRALPRRIARQSATRSYPATWTMLRRNARLRREYLYKKSADAKDRATSERKRKVRDAVEAGKPIPTELRGEADALQVYSSQTVVFCNRDRTPWRGRAARAGV